MFNREDNMEKGFIHNRWREAIAVKIVRFIRLAVLSVLLGTTLQACAIGKMLITKSADPVEVTGIYNLILYGCRYPQDLENMAILVDTHSAYPLDVYSLKGMYKVKTGLSGPQALKEANAFVNCGMNPLWQTVLRKIPDVGGKTIGYELKPLYRDISPAEPLISRYTLKNGEVIAYIRLDYSLEKNYGGGKRKR
jgi:hypothetical protein